ncbi:Thiamin pyrophosphokinase [Cylindrobasidium torrendii FP15055 ss-10]|uniref:Thiamin pyrophosphokinase n=1 Tax=Cylindrobasidium torrendii FP15055 ss-10 TaxID=1314674 RepID=A0A0D7BNA9_9AGAR|nr:Thiamin pyrophosphokinase [Cylindrobasidium torrendii FP15055 ss-10]
MSAAKSEPTVWNVDFISPSSSSSVKSPQTPKRALIILNQPFSLTLLSRLWNKCHLKYCADGGANRLYDTATPQANFIPDAVIGDLDSLRGDARGYYTSKGVSVTQDHDQNSTDLMKCMDAITKRQNGEVSYRGCTPSSIILLGGLAGRLDQTIHTLAYLHKLRKDHTKRVFAVTDDNLGWVLNSGEHLIHIDHNVLGKTCGLLPVGNAGSVLSTSGLEWDLTNRESSFDGLVSTSNHLLPSSPVVLVNTSQPIWWTVELHARITVLYFAGALTAAGVDEETMNIPMKGFYLSQLADILTARHPNVGLEKILATSQWSVDEEMIDNPKGFELVDGAEVAVICPVSGG